MMAIGRTTPASYAPPLDPVRALTAQQTRVAEGIRRGLSYAAIGAEMGIDKGTVKHHVQAIMNVLPNPDNLEPRDCVFLWAWWRAWHESVREKIMRRCEDDARAAS